MKHLQAMARNQLDKQNLEIQTSMQNADKIDDLDNQFKSQPKPNIIDILKQDTDKYILIFQRLVGDPELS